MLIRSAITFILASLSTWAIGQFQFDNRNDLLAERDLHSAVPVGIADINGDGLDDIVSLDLGRYLYIQYQTPDPARPFVRYKAPITLDNAEQNDIILADFNNDGNTDILAVGSYDRIKVLYGVPYTYEMNLFYITVTPFFSQGASSGDFNQDGWVDVVLLNDNGLNYTLINDGSGHLVEQNFFNFVTVPASDNSGNYGSLYTDFDMDGDLDFYIAKCRQGVNNPADPRRIDVLFVNDGTGQYTENAAKYGLADGRQTWTADFGDIDNDGDLDLFKTQHDVVCELYENINNDTFINITPSTGLNIGGVPLQGMIRDFDNDGFQDILVSGDRVDMYHNNGDKTFTKVDPFEAIIFGTFALGDLNADGFTDVYASRVIPFNNPDPLREDILYLNQPNGNHYLALTLTETQGNPSAIGAMALLYGPWGTQVREVRGGEQYGVSHSHGMVFGLGAHTTYDSLVIRWADGSREHFDQLETDRNWNLRRGGCYHQPLALLNPLHVLCNEESLIVRLDTDFDLLSWSNGSTEDSLVISQPGIYYAWLTDDQGCPVRTNGLEVTPDPDTIRPEIYYVGNTLLCNGEVAELSLPSGAGFQWSSGETTQTIEATETGDYYALVQGYCKQSISDTIHLEFLVPDFPITTQDTFLPGESAILTATGDSILWFADPNGLMQIGHGNILQLDDLEDTTTVYAQNLRPIEGQDFQVGPAAHQGLTKYNAAFINGGTLFEVMEPVILHQITVFTDSIGARIIDINNGIDFFYEYQVDLAAGMTVINLDVELPVGAYTMTTNQDLNNLVFGANSPYLWRSSEGVLYPYEIPGVLSITNSTYGEDFFYYFYDWKVSTADKYCGSDLAPATALLDLGTATHETGDDDDAVVIAPNPTDGMCRLFIRSTDPAHVQVSAMDGVILYNQDNIPVDEGSFLLNLSDYPQGIYLVRIQQSGKSLTRKVARL